MTVMKLKAALQKTIFNKVKILVDKQNAKD